MNNNELTKALEVLKKTCEENSGCCTKCPLGYSTSQNGGDDCRLVHTHPKNFKIATPNWKALG